MDSLQYVVFVVYLVAGLAALASLGLFFVRLLGGRITLTELRRSDWPGLQSGWGDPRGGADVAVRELEQGKPAASAEHRPPPKDHRKVP